jgi:bifunctional non-homologous end joining protein LigD
MLSLAGRLLPCFSYLCNLRNLWMIPISHPEKVLFPGDGITKGELASYYEAIAPVMIPHIRRRPITMERYHRGIGAPGFFQKDVSKGFPEWLKRVEVPKHGGTVHHPIANDTRSLVWLANQNSITVHVWPSRTPKLYNPDICVFDLDPSKTDEVDSLCVAALSLRDLLSELGLPSWVKTSGSKGFHIAVPLDGKSEFGEVARFAHSVGRILVTRNPDILTQEFHKVDRGGRILVDTGRNGYSATFAAAYTVRARAGAPVSAPCSWEELERRQVGPQSFRMLTMAQRLSAVGDLWAEMLKSKRSLRRPMERLRQLTSVS